MRKEIATLRRIAGEIKEVRKTLERGKVDVNVWHELTGQRDVCMIVADKLESRVKPETKGVTR
jgi:hypothetical protein